MFAFAFVDMLELHGAAPAHFRPSTRVDVFNQLTRRRLGRVSRVQKPGFSALPDSFAKAQTCRYRPWTQSAAAGNAGTSEPDIFSQI